GERDASLPQADGQALQRASYARSHLLSHGAERPRVHRSRSVPTRRIARRLVALAAGRGRATPGTRTGVRTFDVARARGVASDGRHAGGWRRLGGAPPLVVARPGRRIGHAARGREGEVVRQVEEPELVGGERWPDDGRRTGLVAPQSTFPLADPFQVSLPLLPSRQDGGRLGGHPRWRGPRVVRTRRLVRRDARRLVVGRRRLPRRLL